MRTLMLAPVALLAAVACTKTEPAAPAKADVALASVAADGDEQHACGGAVAAVEEPSCEAHEDVAPSRTCGGSGHAVAHAEPARSEVQVAFDHAPVDGEKALCLVMNREFVIDDKTATSVYEGKTYAFCCDGCKQAFDENPAKFVHADVKAPNAPAPPSKS